MIFTLSFPHFLFCNFTNYRFPFGNLQISILQITYCEFTSQNKDFSFHFVLQKGQQALAYEYQQEKKS